MADLHVLPIATEAIFINPHNARTHTAQQVDQIAASIKRFGFTNPVLLDEMNILIAGHGRLAAAKTLGIEILPAIRIAHLSEPEKRALMLADNKIAANAGWDIDRLAAELADLSALELDFDLEVTGFETAEIDLLLTGDEPRGEQEILPPPDERAPKVCDRGDLWILGKHRILCGDARNADDVARLMREDRAAVGFTDPPYNVPIAGHVSGGGKVTHREFTEAVGEMNEAEFTSFLTEAFTLASSYSKPGAVWYACMDWRHMAEIISAGKSAFGPLINLCVWAKTNGGMGSLYRSQHELIFVFRNGMAQHRNNVQLGKFGRNRTNLWTYPGVNTFRNGRMEELHAHPTAKPVAMIEDALLDVSKRGDIVFDSFLGAGATLIAAEKSGRVARGIEIDPLYVDATLRRWRKLTGEEPLRERDGKYFSALESEIIEAAE